MSHLEEHENTMACREELRQDTIEQFELAGDAMKQLLAASSVVLNRLLDRSKDERVIADLAELHEHVVEALHLRRLVLAHVVFDEEELEFFDLTVELCVAVRPTTTMQETGERAHSMLKGAHLALDDPLDLVRQIGLDVLLQSTKKERSKDFMQTANDEQGLLFIQVNLLLTACIRKGGVEPLVERLDRVEDLGQDEVEQRPKFGKVVLRAASAASGSSQGGEAHLQRSAGQDETIASRVVLSDRLRELALRILHPLTFVDDFPSSQRREMGERGHNALICAHLILASVGRSLMMYSYVVRQTLKWPGRSWLPRVRRA